MRLFALFGLGFPPAPRLLSLNLAAYGNSQAHSTKGTPSPLTRLRPLVGPRFQVLFHSPPGVLFLPSIQPWRVVPPASAWIPRVPAYSGTAPSGSLALRLRGFHPLRPAFPDRSAALSRPPVTPAPPYNPAHVAACGLGSSPFARRYWGNLV